MTVSPAVAALRSRTYALEALPETLPPRGDGAEAKPLEDATLDDIAFALIAVDAELSAVSDKYHALRKLYALGRQAGAVGADRIVDALPPINGGH